MGKNPSIAGFISEQYTNPPPLHADLTGKTVLVVGANTGIGFEAAKHFARMRPKKLILGCRNEGKGRNAVNQIEQETRYRAELGYIDLSSFGSVIDFARSLEDEPLDIVVMNAAVLTAEYKETSDGWESSLQINHLSIALLSILLTPNMACAAKSGFVRLVIVTSDVHYRTKFGDEFSGPRGILGTLNDRDFCTNGGMSRRYLDSKLLNVLFTRAFTHHLPPGSPLIATCVNPGFCVSEIRRNLVGGHKLFTSLLEAVVGRTAEQGSRQILWAALGPDASQGELAKDMQGAYVSASMVKEPSDFVISDEGKVTEDRIWTETIETLAKITPAVSTIVGEYFTVQT